MTTATGLCRLLALLVPFVACLAWALHLQRRYTTLPPRFAVHFSLSGDPNGWMSPRSFALLTIATLAIVLVSTAAMVSSLPAALFAHPLPPAASIASTLSTALAVGAFFEIVRLARSSHGSASPRLRWSRILSWPVTLLALQTLLAALALHV